MTLHFIYTNSLCFCFSCHCNERLFLRDLVLCSPGTSGGRLARWLQPESHVDPARCQLVFPRDEMRCGWPAVVTLTTRDQYGEIVHVPNLKVNHDKPTNKLKYGLVYKNLYGVSSTQLCPSPKPKAKGHTF